MKRRKAKKKGIVLTLYVTGAGRNSAIAVSEIKRVCDRLLKASYALEIRDLYLEPGLAREANLFAAPTLEVKKPKPERRFIGSCRDVERLFKSLGFIPE